MTFFNTKILMMQKKSFENHDSLFYYLFHHLLLLISVSTDLTDLSIFKLLIRKIVAKIMSLLSHDSSAKHALQNHNTVQCLNKNVLQASFFSRKEFKKTHREMPDTDDEEDKCPICLSEIVNPSQPENCKVKSLKKFHQPILLFKAHLLFGALEKMGHGKDHLPLVQRGIQENQILAQQEDREIQVWPFSFFKESTDSN